MYTLSLLPVMIVEHSPFQEINNIYFAKKPEMSVGCMCLLCFVQTFSSWCYIG